MDTAQPKAKAGKGVLKEHILMAISAAGPDGISSTDIYELIKNDLPTTTLASVQNVTASMVPDGTLKRTGERMWYRYHIGDGTPAPAEAEPEAPKETSSNGHGGAIDPYIRDPRRPTALPAYMKNWKGVELEVLYAPKLYGQAMRLFITYDLGTWIPLPLQRNQRIFIGVEAPQWGATMTVYRQVRAAKVVYRADDDKVYEDEIDLSQERWVLVVDERD